MRPFLVVYASVIVATEARLFASLSESLTGQGARGANASGRISRHRELMGKSSDKGAFGQIWNAAIATSDSTATVDGKCRLPNGKVVGIGQHYYYHGKGKGYYDDDCESSKGKGKSSKAKSSKGSKSSSSSSSSSKGKGKSGRTCAPTSSPTESASPTVSIAPSTSPAPTVTGSGAPSAAPTATPTISAAPSVSKSPSATPTFPPTDSPTDCDGKSYYSCSKNLRKKTRKSDRHMSSKSSKGKSSKGKSSKGKGSKGKGSKGKSSKGKNGNYSSKGKEKYEDVDIPYCSELTHAPTGAPTKSPTISTASVDLCNSILDRSVKPKGRVKQEAKVYAIVVEPIPEKDLAEEIDHALLVILAFASGCDVELNFGDGRRILSESNTVTPVATSDQVTKMEVDDSCSTFKISSEDRDKDDLCTVYTSGIRVYGRELSDIQETFNSFREEIEDYLGEKYGVKSFHFVVDQLPLDILQPDSEDKEDAENEGNTGGSKDTGASKDIGASKDEDSSDGVSAVVGPETRSISNKEGLSGGGFVGLAGAGLIILLLLLLFVRRRRDKDKDAARHYEYTDEDENSNFIDENSENAKDFENAENSIDDSFSDVPPGRLAHVVGEDDSQYTGMSWGGKSKIRIEPVKSIPEDTLSNPVEISPKGVPYEEERRHDIGQTCSSPTCKICDARRQQGATTKFVRNQKYDPSPGQGSYDRDYISSDTVDL